jgi:2-methylcitrate dehydratase
VQRMGFKRYPSEGSTQSVLELTPQIRAWTKAEDIASIHVELPFNGWQETADPPKWDPRNRETADHSMPCVIATALIDGEIYLDSFTPKRFEDPAVRRLMAKITVGPNAGMTYQGCARLTVRTKAGGELIKETSVHLNTPMTHDEIVTKFNRVCAFMSVADDQRDQAYADWSNLRAVKDIAAPMRGLAHFGRPLPL